MKRFLLCCATGGWLLAVATPAPGAELRPPARHVVVIGVDGMSPDGVRKADTPNMDALRRRGAWTFHARGVMPTSSSPNWASMIMGAGPEQHGVTSNAWEPDHYEIAPIVKGPSGMFPTIFSVLRHQRPAAVIACFHDWKDFGRLIEPGVANVNKHCEGPRKTIRCAIEYPNKRQPDFLFIHLDHVDHAGHTYGWGTPKYYAAVAKADRLIGRFIQALKTAGIFQETVVFVSADHGGKGKSHGGATMAEIEIPWIVAGPGIVRGREITDPVNTYDTAPTIAYLLGLRAPKAWIGKPVRQALTTAP